VTDEHTTGARALVAMVERLGVRHVFGLCGHTNVAVLAALEHSSVRFVGVHHEQMASHAADGYHRATGELGVVLTHLGPGLTNALTGVANATLDAVPMLVISGNVQSYFFGRRAHMESALHGDADQAECYRPFVKRIWRVERPEALVPALEAAVRVASTGQPGPVLVDVAMDVFSAEVPFDDDWEPAAPPHRPDLPGDTAAAIASALRTAERPVIYVGGGVVRAGAQEALIALAEAAKAPVAYSQLGKGAIPDDHPLTVGLTGLWGTPAANEACRSADVLLAVATHFGELDASSWQPGTTFSIPPTRLLHVHADPQELGRSYRPELGAVADPGRALRAIAAAYGPGDGGDLRLSPALAELRTAFEDEVAAAAASDQMPLHPSRVLDGVRAVLTDDALLVGDTGWNKNGVGQQLPVRRPDQFMAPAGFATMGFGPAAALGAAVARPDSPVIALVGDGAFLTNLSVIVTAVEERIPVVWAVMNNGAYATISGLERRHFDSDYGAVFDAGPTDYASVARSVGAGGARVERPEDLVPALTAALDARRPYVLDIPCSMDHVPTTGHWDINDLFAQAAKVS